MKKIIVGMIVAVFTFIAVLPTNVMAAETEEGIVLTDNENSGVEVTLTMPNAAQEGIGTIKVSLEVTGDGFQDDSVTFTFSDVIEERAKISEYRYHSDTNELNIYVSDTDPLFTENETTLLLGTIQAGKNYQVRTFDTSLTTVIGTNETVIAFADYPEVTISDENPKRPDETVLKQLEEKIQYAESIAKGNYTADSYENLQLALANAKKVWENPQATDEEIAQALQDLNNAISALVLIKNEDSAQNKHEDDILNQKVPDDTIILSENTGDTTKVQPYVYMIAISSLFIGAYLYKKQKDKSNMKKQ